MGARIIAGLDIGTAGIKAAVAEHKGGKPFLRSVFHEPSAGMRKGVIAELGEAVSAVTRAIAELKKIAKAAPKNLYVNIGTPHMRAQSSRGIVAVSRADSEIYQDDVDRAVKASQAVNLAHNRVIIHNVTREYIVDGVGDVADPLGLSGNRLEVSSLIIEAFAPHIKNITRVIELAGGRICGLVADPLLGSRAALRKSQKDLGAVVIDLGHGTTSMSVYEENKLLGVAVFPVGAGNITNDLAIGLKIPVMAAENLKLHVGRALAKEVSPKESIDLAKFSPESKGTVSRRFVAEIIESRLAEIFEFVNNELKLMGKAGQLAGGVVLVGGGANMPGLAELAKQELKLSAQIGFAAEDEWAEGAGAFAEISDEPEFVNALGLVLCGAEREGWRSSGGGSIVKTILRYFVP